MKLSLCPLVANALDLLFLTAIEAAAERLSAQSVPSVVWNSDDMHYSDGGQLTVQYLFVLDALNFCFWPGKLLDL